MQSWCCPWDLLGLIVWRKASVMLRPRRCRSCFRDRCSQLISACLPEIGCQGWTRTNTVRFNKPSCYFDTTWQLGIGAAGRICTCIGSFRRRMPRRFRPRQHFGNGQRGRICTCDPSVPSRVRWLLRYALKGPALYDAGAGEHRTPTLATVLR